MNHLMMTVLSLSISGAILIAIILLCRPLYKQRLSKRWQYYIWLIVIARLLIPFSLEINLVGSLINEATPAGITQSINENHTRSDLRASYRNFVEGIPATPYTPSQQAQYHTQSITQEPARNLLTNIANTILSNLWIAWLVIAIALFVRKITIYQSFVRFVKAGRKPVEDFATLERFGRMLEQAGIKRTVGLYTNSLVSSPLLIGFFRPYIVLPTLNINESDFRHTIQHELTHYRRGDMFYKWLVQLTICLHWFNPLVHVMANEINNACEFSCDEAVIKNLGQNAIKSYGDTLLGAINIGRNFRSSLSAVSLSGNNKIIKERLDMIKNYRRKPRIAIATALIAALILGMGALVIGAYATASTVYANNPNNIHEIIGETQVSDSAQPGTVIYRRNEVGQRNIVGSGSFTASEGQFLDLRISSSIRGGTADLFLFAPDGTEHRFTIGRTLLTTREVSLTDGVWAYNVFGQFSGGDIIIEGTIREVSPAPAVPPTPTAPPVPMAPPATPQQNRSWSNITWPWEGDSFTWPWEEDSWPWNNSSTWPWSEEPHDWHNWSVNNSSTGGLVGIGPMVTREFLVENFTGMDLSIPADITWRRASETSITVVMQENFFEYLTLSINNNILTIRSQTHFSTTAANRPRIYIYSPYVNNLVLSGALDTINWDIIYAENLRILASGAVNATLDLQVNRLDVTGSGATDFFLSGSAGTANITVSGATDFHGFDLQIRDAVLAASGASDVDVSVSHSLNVNASGASDVRYKGNPTVTQRVSGSSTLIRM